MSPKEENSEIEAVLVTAILCTVQTRKNKRFRFCIPGGAIIDYNEMEELARENGVNEEQWLLLLDKIEEAMESMI
jgi:selenophosphate synthase